jgi:hypothetical protein
MPSADLVPPTQPGQKPISFRLEKMAYRDQTQASAGPIPQRAQRSPGPIPQSSSSGSIMTAGPRQEHGKVQATLALGCAAGSDAPRTSPGGFASRLGRPTPCPKGPALAAEGGPFGRTGYLPGGWSSSQGFGCLPIKVVRELGRGSRTRATSSRLAVPRGELLWPGLF